MEELAEEKIPMKMGGKDKISPEESRLNAMKEYFTSYMNEEYFASLYSVQKGKFREISVKQEDISAILGRIGENRSEYDLKIMVVACCVLAHVRKLDEKRKITKTADYFDTVNHELLKNIVDRSKHFISNRKSKLGESSFALTMAKIVTYVYYLDEISKN